jgi:hypothetical protein
MLAKPKLYSHKDGWAEGTEEVFKGQFYYELPWRDDAVFMFNYDDGAIILYRMGSSFIEEWPMNEKLAGLVREGMDISLYPFHSEEQLKMIISKAKKAEAPQTFIN